MTLTAGTRLGPYEILSQLGAGGMGEVYRARDTKLDRDVAVKVLPASVASDPGVLARFEREAKAVAALSHPNILSIFDFGAQDGVTYAVMELLEGETLRARLESGPIPQKDALDYAVQIARGVSAAHERAVVHRDLKPENLFVSKDGHVKILDFGLARRDAQVAPDEETSAPTQSGHTEPGTVMGTLGYMSPEQVRGLAVDHRTDIFSFGAVLYEMLSGSRAFRRATAADTMSAILNEKPPQLTQTGRNVSVGLDHVVEHCLEKDRERRFQSARDIVFALGEAPGATTGFARPAADRRWRWIAAAAVVVAAAAIGLILARRSASPSPSGLKRIAVLPFENVGTVDDDYFADGMADEIRGKLTSLKGIEVIARGSSLPYRKTSKTPTEIAKELDVDYLLTATVRWQRGSQDNRILVTPELVEVSAARAPASRWQQSFDASLDNVFKVQATIASSVAEALGIALGVDEQRGLLNSPTTDLAAYDAFLKGKKVFEIDRPERQRQAAAFYEQAVALDPTFAEAWSALSLTSSMIYLSKLEPETDAAARARQAGETALRLAPAAAGGYLALGSYEWLVTQDFNRALEHLSRGQGVAPRSAELLWARGAVEVNLGRWEEGLRHYREAEAFDPRSVDVKLYLGAALTRTRRYAEARTVLDQGLLLAPSNLSLLVYKAMTYLGEGNLEAARAVLASAPNDVGPATLVAFTGAFWDLVWLLDEGQRRILLRLTPEAFDNDRETWATALAQAYSLAGDRLQMRTYAQMAEAGLEQALKTNTLGRAEAYVHARLGLIYAYLDKRKEAVSEGQLAASMAPTEDSWMGAPFRYELARIYTIIGDRDRAIDVLEALLRKPYVVSRAWLKIDPNFDPLRGHPRFQKLVAGQ